MVGYGRLSATDQRVPDGDTVFEIASTTKVFTGILLVQAVANGEVRVVYAEFAARSPAHEPQISHLSNLPTPQLDNAAGEFLLYRAR